MWVVEGTSVVRRPVTIESIEDDHAYVTGSLKQGDRVVALGAHLLTEGAQVRVAEAAPAATPATAGAARE